MKENIQNIHLSVVLDLFAFIDFNVSQYTSSNVFFLHSAAHTPIYILKVFTVEFVHMSFAWFYFGTYLFGCLYFSYSTYLYQQFLHISSTYTSEFTGLFQSIF